MVINEIKKNLKKNKFLYYLYSFIKKNFYFQLYISIWNRFLSKLDTKQYNSNIKKYEITNRLLQDLINKNEKKIKYNFLNLGSGLAEIKCFTEYTQNKISYVNFFDNFNYYTLDFFELDLNTIKTKGDYVVRPDKNLTKQKIDSRIFQDYPNNFHKKHIVFDLNNIYDDQSFFCKFDFIYCEDVLEHLYYPFNLPVTIFNLLKKNGICLLMTPFSYPYHKDPEDYYRFTHKGLENLFKKNKNLKFEIQELGYSTEIRREKRNIEHGLRSYWIENWWSIIVIKKL
jgi:SAM-dependent methyltransferase